MRFEEWVKAVPGEITGDSLWKVEAYRLALYAADLGWHDATRLMKDKRTMALSDQLYRALGGISSNVAEGYSRGTGPDRARFYEYALGSARESRNWYYQARHLLGEEVTAHRLALLTPIIRLLLTMVPQQRGRLLREERAEYQVSSTDPHPESSSDSPDLNTLLTHVPLP
ncbi:MAG: four helix bundle protein [Armatimonadetes bacterium]|nr:four helix bundle protein [Armatimonadota bacterium]